MSSRFAYAKPPIFHYQTLDLSTLQFTKHPIITPRPKTPEFAKQSDPEEPEKEAPPNESQDTAKEEEQTTAPEVVESGDGQSSDVTLVRASLI